MALYTVAALKLIINYLQKFKINKFAILKHILSAFIIGNFLG